MRRRTARALLSVPLLAACALTACSDSPDTTGPAARTSPLTAYFEAVYGGEGSQEEREKEYAEQNKRSEELIATCMKEEGFEYTPNTSSVEFASSGVEWEPDSREFVSQYGYGAVKQPGQEDAEASAEQFEDPNGEYVASLSESEQVAYQEALSGPQPTEEEMAAMESGEYEWKWENAGCSGKAQHEVMGEDPMQSDEHKPLMDAVSKFYEEQPTWPEMAELNAAWATCMAEAGHPGLTTQSEAAQTIYDKQNKLYESAGEAPVDQAALDALGKEEVELALADLDCREKTDYQKKSEEVVFDKEQQFVDDHEAELEAMKADAEQGR